MQKPVLPAVPLVRVKPAPYTRPPILAARERVTLTLLVLTEKLPERCGVGVGALVGVEVGMRIGVDVGYEIDMAVGWGLELVDVIVVGWVVVVGLVVGEILILVAGVLVGEVIMRAGIGAMVGVGLGIGVGDGANKWVRVLMTLVMRVSSHVINLL